MTEEEVRIPDDEVAPDSSNGSTPPHRFALEDLEELDPMRYWQELTERQIANFDSRIARIQADLQPLIERRDALKRALTAAASKTLSGKVVTRMKLPSAPHKAPAGKDKKARYPVELIERVKELIRDNPQMKNGEIASLAGGEISASMVSYYRHSTFHD